jgi:hypothetical protein
VSKIDYEINTQIAQRTVGMLLDNAEVYVEVFGLQHRVMMLDGAGMMHVNDARMDRVNFDVVKGKVTRAYLG